MRQVSQLKNEIISNKIALKNANDNEQTLSQSLNSLEHKLSHAIQDPITHLLGWELFTDRLNQSIKESARYQLTQAILFIDIDDFKKINNALGYEVGDAVLLEVAKRLQTCIRQVDSITRFSKDTFVCLLTQLAKPETAAIVAQRMLQALAQDFQIKGHELYLTAGIGISIFPMDAEGATTLLRNGEYALHLAKEKGRHVYQFYHEKTHINSLRELALSTSLNNESALREFVLYYQPIINTQDESIFCMDALLYWQHKSLGLIDSQELFNYAEKQRKLDILTDWSLRHACQQFLKWRSLDFSPSFLGISVSIRQLESSHFIYRISQILQELQFKPEWLLLEIKISHTPLSLDVLEKAFNMLKYLGIKIAIDDFGTSPFSLAYLKNITIHYLKMDQSIIDDLDINQQTIALVKSFVMLAANASMQLIAQGIESSGQINLLKELGCYLMQGKFLTPPLSEREVSDKMLAHLKQP